MRFRELDRMGCGEKSVGRDVSRGTGRRKEGKKVREGKTLGVRVKVEGERGDGGKVWVWEVGRSECRSNANASRNARRLYYAV